jgi:hypothetical protein
MIKADISGSNQIRILWASAAEPFQHIDQYEGLRANDQLAIALDRFRAAPGGWASAIIFTHKRTLGVAMARDCETNEPCFWDGTI